jgi:hypothetical protein
VGFDALVGSQFLDPYNYARFGDYFVLAKKKATPLASAQNTATGNAIANFLSGGLFQLRADSRPVGTMQVAVTQAGPFVGTDGQDVIDGGYAVNTHLNTGAFAGSSSFLIKSGLRQTLISEATAEALGISLGSLPLVPVDLSIGDTVMLPSMTMNVNVFGDTDVSMSVAIISNSLNPFNLNYLSSDFLNQYGYYEVNTSEGSSSGLLYGAVPGPATPALLALAGIVTARRRR